MQGKTFTQETFIWGFSGDQSQLTQCILAIESSLSLVLNWMFHIVKFQGVLQLHQVNPWFEVALTVCWQCNQLGGEKHSVIIAAYGHWLTLHTQPKYLITCTMYFCCNIIKSDVNLLYFYEALMELLDKVQFSYDTSDQDVNDITDGEWQHKTWDLIFLR